MDYTTVLLDNVPDAAIGDEVVCIGKQGEYEITVDDWAKLKGTHAYEVLCSVGTRVNRKFI
jgi:alanine racemase